MSSRLVAPLVAAAAVVFACGRLPRPALQLGASRAPDVDIGRDTERPRRARRGDSTVVDASLVVRQSKDGAVRFALAVVNGSRHRLEIDFPDGHTQDFAVMDEAGRAVWRSDRGRLFTQAVQAKLLAAGDTATYEAQWREATPGRYTVVAVLRSDNFPVTRQAAFVIGGDETGLHAALPASARPGSGLATR
jgi:hypothetical protein